MAERTDKPNQKDRSSQAKTEWQKRNEAYLKQKEEVKKRREAAISAADFYDDEEFEEVLGTPAPILTADQVLDPVEEADDDIYVDNNDENDIYIANDDFYLDGMYDDVADFEGSKTVVVKTPLLVRLKNYQAKKKAQQAVRSQGAQRGFRIPWRSIIVSTPLVISAVVLLILSLYFLSSYSKLKEVTVSGNSYLTTDRVLELTGIYKNDYTITTLLNKEKHAKNVKKASNMVKKSTIKYTFPLTFHVEIEEYQIIAYVREANSYYPVLSNGNMAPTDPISAATLPEQHLLLNFNDEAMVKHFVLQLSGLPETTIANIASVVHSPNATTSDLLTVSMHDGHVVHVPLSELAEKMGFYPNVVAQLTTASIIDMEVGIYAYAAPTAPEVVAETAENREEVMAEENLVVTD